MEGLGENLCSAVSCYSLMLAVMNLVFVFCVLGVCQRGMFVYLFLCLLFVFTCLVTSWRYCGSFVINATMLVYIVTIFSHTSINHIFMQAFCCIFLATILIYFASLHICQRNLNTFHQKLSMHYSSLQYITIIGKTLMYFTLVFICFTTAITHFPKKFLTYTRNATHLFYSAAILSWMKKWARHQV